MSTQRSKTTILLILCFLLMLTFAFNATAADYVIVAHKGVSANSISRDDAEAIFLGDKSKWDDGKPVRIAILEGTPAARSFLQRVVGKTPSQFDYYWKKLVFAGKASAPKVFEDSSSLIQYVSATSGAIGFVGDGQAGGSVKTIPVK